MTEFLHNMSTQALSKSNAKMLLEFDKIVDLIGYWSYWFVTTMK